MIVRSLADEQEWRQTVAGCPYATFFQTPEWFTAFTSSDPGLTTGAWSFDFADSARAIFPFLSRRGSGAPPLWLSGPAGVYGGWISLTPLLPDQQQQIVDFLISRQHALIWRINPFAGLQTDFSRAKLRPDHTTVLDLELGLEAIFRSWSKGHHAAVNQAMRHDIQVRRGYAITDWQSYFSCYQDSLRRWGSRASSRYPWEFFATLARLPERSVSLWLAEKDHRLQAGALCFSHNRHTVYWHGAAYEWAFPDRPVHLLMHEIIHDACDRKDKWFDFNPSGGHEGVERFKKGFGGRQLSAPVLDTRRPSLRQRILAVVRSRLAGGAPRQNP